jgi:deoxyadenosine/deoxycytidine kinase
MSEMKPSIPEHIRYLCIEGVIGVGKTSLSVLLAERFNARLILERSDENPFLGRYYSDPVQYAFQTQLWFLLSRYRQLDGELEQFDLFHHLAIADYMFAKDGIFATVTLDDHELALYNGIKAMLEPRLPPPDFIVYLQASTDVLMKRIEKRGRACEFAIDRDYLDILNQAYKQFFFQYTASPVLIINTDHIDFVENACDLDDIAGQIARTYIGTTFYQPLGAGGRRKGRS